MKQYIGSQEQFEDEVNAYYDQKEAYEKDMQEQPDPRIEEWYEYLEQLENEK